MKASIVEFAEKWNLGRNEVAGFLKVLAAKGFVTVESVPNGKGKPPLIYDFPSDEALTVTHRKLSSRKGSTD